MEESDRKNLRLVYQSQRLEFLQHRLSISNAFALVTTGLVVLLGLLVTADSVTPSILRIVTGVGVLTMVLFTCGFMGRQRSEANKTLRILIKIEKQFGFFIEDKYIPGDRVLQAGWENPPNSPCGFTKGDLIQVGSLLSLMVAVEVALFWPCLSRLLTNDA